MISVADAVKKASSEVANLFPPTEKMRLEEVDSTDDDGFWLITVSFVDKDRESPLLPALPAFGPDSRARAYKVVKINKDTGEVRSIKIREGIDV